MSRILLAVILVLSCSAADAVMLCPDGSYVSGPYCQMAPDGSYFSSNPRIAPYGRYVAPRIAPYGSSTPGPSLMPDRYIAPQIAPDGSYR
jgi:hypothetical protein